MNESQWWNRFHSVHIDPHEWYGDGSSSICDVLGLSRSRRILHVGCGSSVLGDALAEAGFSVLNNDFSETVIDAQIQRTKGQILSASAGQQSFSCFDATVISEALLCAFDIVVDKGTLDAILADRREDTLEAASRAIAAWLGASRRSSPKGCGTLSHLVIGSMISPAVRIPDLQLFMPGARVKTMTDWPPRPWDMSDLVPDAQEGLLAGDNRAIGQPDIPPFTLIRVHEVREPPLEKPSQQCWWWYEVIVKGA